MDIRQQLFSKSSGSHVGYKKGYKNGLNKLQLEATYSLSIT